MPDIRQRMEALELELLVPWAAQSRNARRHIPLDPCEVRTAYQRDRDRIIHSKSFRRLKHKTQVFLSPEGDHYRTRLTHTLEVCQIARVMARALRLNEDLTEAISLGHDLGHTPFGHAGERALNRLCPGGFSHAAQSVRVAEHIDKLNLTEAVLDGFACHAGDVWASTQEGRLVKYADRFAYINHDIDDAIRSGIMQEADIPSDFCRILGSSHSQRIDTMVRSVIFSSLGMPEIRMDPQVEKATMGLRAFMFEAVYLNPAAKSEEGKAEEMLAFLYRRLTQDPSLLPQEYRLCLEAEGPDRAACDYLAGMSDRFAVAKFNELFVPRVWQKV